jgi:hypothetical protein
MPFVSNLQNSPGWTLPPVFCLLFFGAIFLILNNAAISATYYLDAINGSDSNPGTSDQPWKTIAEAQGIVISGDTIIVRNGSYGSYSEANVGRTDWVTYIVHR